MSKQSLAQRHKTSRSSSVKGHDLLPDVSRPLATYCLSEGYCSRHLYVPPCYVLKFERSYSHHFTPRRHLLGMLNLWKVLTGERPEPAIGTAEHTVWETNQDKLSSLLLLIPSLSALSLIELKSNKTATEQYNYLKDEYNTTTITTYSTLYRLISKCHISNHKSLKKYGEVVSKARNKLKGLNEPMPEVMVTCCFLDRLDASYSVWKDMFLRGYAQNPTKTTDGKIMVRTIEGILKELID